MKIQTFIIIFTLTLIAGILRFYDLKNNPVSLSVDEVSIGYNAYSILKTGKDEYGETLPLTFKSLGDYKGPLFVYLTIPSIAVFGLSEFGIRFPTAFLSTLMIPLLYFFLLQFVKDKKYALIGAVLLTISPWHISYSRVAHEYSVALFLMVLGIFFLLKLESGKWYWAVLASLFLVASMYTYHAQRLFVPLFSTAFIGLNLRKLLLKKMALSIFIVTSLVLVIPLLWSIIFGLGKTRAQMTIITNDVDFIRYVMVAPLQKISGMLSYLIEFFGSQTFLIFFYWARKILAYFQPSFIFYSSLGMTNAGTYGLGIVYLFELPFLILGLITLIKIKVVNRGLLLAWFLIGLLPASLTQNEQHSGRTIIILPMILLVSAIGAVSFFNLSKKYFSLHIRGVIYLLFGVAVTWNLLLALLIFSVHYPKEKGEGIMEGTKQAVEFALVNKNNYQEIVFDPVRGVDGPYIVNAPHVYILFYAKYDPARYQTETKRQGENLYGFDKFTIRPIKWREDQSKTDTLFIGSPWSLPVQDLKEEEILHKIYLSNGKLALLIVSPKK